MTKLSHTLSCVMCLTGKDKNTITRLSTDLLDPSLHPRYVETLAIIGQQCATDFNDPAITGFQLGAFSHELQ